MGRPAVDMTGQRYGMLTVERRVGAFGKGRGRGQAVWQCRCDCGGTKDIRRDHLVAGNSVSCGCQHPTLHKGVKGFRKTHGMSHLAEYQIWHGIRDRCDNPGSKEYQNYGGRGIAVCNRWRDFQAFIADMGTRPSADHSIDRIDNDGNYEPGNCRWATLREQARNKRTNRWIEVDGARVIMADAIAASGKQASTVYQRIRNGWPIDRALKLPVQRAKRH